MKLKILSIDFDFFQDTDIDTLRYGYPEGIDLSTGLSKIVWAGKYSTKHKYGEKIKSVKINIPLFNQIIDILNNQNCNIPVLIAQSHVSIYDFIHENMKDKDKLDIVNIDLHHDILNDNDELDCGNWICHIVSDFPNTNVQWITRKVSLECYGMNSNRNIPARFDFDKIQNECFDAIFLCRSDAWVPPHLDDYFDEMIDFCTDKFNNVIGQKEVLTPRDISDIIKIEDEIFEKFQNEVNMNVNSNSAVKQKA